MSESQELTDFVPDVNSLGLNTEVLQQVSVFFIVVLSYLSLIGQKVYMYSDIKFSTIHCVEV